MKKLLILSGKGGTGKTTVASAFIVFSKAKAFADCDVDAPNLHMVTEHNNKPIENDFFGGDKSVIDLDKCTGCGECVKYCRFEAIKPFESKFQVNEFACEGCGVCNLVCKFDAVTMNKDIAGRLELYKNTDSIFSTAELKMGRGNSGKLVAEVKKQIPDNIDTDLCIIDGSPGIGCPVIASITGVDMVLIVAEPSLSGISDMERILGTAEKFEIPSAVCVNKSDTSIEKTNFIKNLCKENKIDFIGTIPYDKEVSKTINKGLSIADVDCKAKDALLEVYKNTYKILFK